MRIVLAVVLTLIAGTAGAQEISRQQAKEVYQACKADVRQLCGEVEPGGGAVLRCLQEKKDSLSSGCTEKLAEIKQLKN